MIFLKTDSISDHTQYGIRFTEKLEDGGKIVFFASKKERDFVYDAIHAGEASKQPTDDDLPIDTTWLESVGCKPDEVLTPANIVRTANGADLLIHEEFDHSGNKCGEKGRHTGLFHLCLTVHPEIEETWDKDEGLAQLGSQSTNLPPVRTRGEFRRVCDVLGITLKA